MCRNDLEGEIGSFARVDHADMLSASYFLLASVHQRARWATKEMSRQGIRRRIGRREHKRRNNLVILCQLRLVFRLLYFCSLSLGGQFDVRRNIL